MTDNIRKALECCPVRVWTVSDLDAYATSYKDTVSISLMGHFWREKLAEKWGSFCEEVFNIKGPWCVSPANSIDPCYYGDTYLDALAAAIVGEFGETK